MNISRAFFSLNLGLFAVTKSNVNYYHSDMKIQNNKWR